MNLALIEWLFTPALPGWNEIPERCAGRKRLGRRRERKWQSWALWYIYFLVSEILLRIRPLISRNGGIFPFVMTEISCKLQSKPWNELGRLKTVGNAPSSRAGIFASLDCFFFPLIHNHGFRMAASREKQRAHRRKAMEKAQVSVELRKPLEAGTSQPRIGDKIKVYSKPSRSALIKGEGRSMGMDIDWPAILPLM